MNIRLVIDASAYVLLAVHENGWTEVARLEGGATRLISQEDPVDAQQLERGIDVAEDWLMPHARRLHDQVLEIEDQTGRFKQSLQDVLVASSGPWSLDDIEGLFGQMVDVATRPKPSLELQKRRAFVADLLLVRELAHHGKAKQVQLG